MDKKMKMKKKHMWHKNTEVKILRKKQMFMHWFYLCDRYMKVCNDI